MAEIKVSEMIEAESVNDEDLIMIVQNGVNKKVPASKVGTGGSIVGDTLPIGAVIDYAGETVPSNWEEVEEEGEAYSTEEQRIGTWIDGKPLYRKTFTIPSTSAKPYYLDTSALNIENGFLDIGHSYLKISLSDGSVRRYFAVGVDVEAASTISNATANSQLQTYFSNDYSMLIIESGSKRTVEGGYVTIEYTKTTD